MHRIIFTITLLFITNTSQAEEPRDHYYAMQTGQAYGYEMADTAELLLIKYLGKRKGLYQAFIEDGESKTVFECLKSCKYLTIYEYEGYRFIEKKILKVVNGSIAFQIMDDMWNDRLTKMNSKLWVDGENGPTWSNE